MTSNQSSISVVVLTLDEELNLPDCLESIRGLALETIVVDSGSTDRTAEIAESFGAEVVVHEFQTQAQQLNWALDNLTFQGDWILRLDADERLMPELAQELREVLPSLGDDITGLYMKRRVYFMGRWMRRGGYYPTWLLRIWRNGCARSEERKMDEHMVLSRGRTELLKNDILEDNQKGLSEWIARQNNYSTREMLVLSEDEAEDSVQASLFGTPEARRRWLKHKVYYRFPPLLRAFVYFGWRYFFLLGFLDGKEGLVFHFLQGCWLRFLIDAKHYESKSNRRGKASSDLPSVTMENKNVSKE